MSPLLFEAIRQFRAMSVYDLRQMGRTAQTILNESLSQSLLTRQFCDAVEKAMRLND